MKAIMISGLPRWTALIANSDKNIEVRSSKALATAIQKLIDEYGYADIYWYCTKDRKQRLYPISLLDKSNQVFKRAYREDKIDNRTNYLNGKVVFKFRCYKVEEIKYFEEFVYPDGFENYDGEWVDTSKIYKNVHNITKGMLEKTCLSYEELQKYLGKKNGYAIHISDLEIFDKPKELSEFRYVLCPRINCEYCKYSKTIEGALFCTHITLTKAPQSMCYIEVD